jgi:transaldolase
VVLGSGMAVSFAGNCVSMARAALNGGFCFADAVSLAGVDYLVVGPKVLQELSVTPTMAGYNDGLSAAGPADTDFEPMSPITAKDEVFTADEQAPLTKQLFEDGLGLVGKELLDEGLAGLVDDINRLEPFFTQLAIGTE